MNIFSRSSLSLRFVLVIALFTLGFVIYGAWSFKTLNELKVNGQIYQSIVQGKDLIADILPPPKYIIESYLVSLQLSRAKEKAEQHGLIDRLKTLKGEYDTRHEFWLKEVLEGNISELLLRQAHVPAVAFYAIVFNELAPAIQKNDRAAAAAAMAQMKSLYEIHRKVIDQIVQLTDKRVEVDEIQAKERIQSASFLLLAILVVTMGVVVAASVRILQVARKMTQNARNMASIVESSNNAIVSVSMNTIITSWNPAAERIYGYSAEEIIGQSFSLLIPPENTHEDADIQSSIRDGNKIKPYETFRIRKDGSTIAISQTVSPIYDESGVVTGASAIARDITEQREASKNIRNMASIIESSNDAITSSSLEGTCTGWNAAAERMYGYSAEEMIGQSFSNLIPPEKVHEHADNRSRIQDGNKIEPYETLRIRKDGSTIAISATVSPIYDESGVVIGASAIARDITGEKQASQNARNMASIIESSNDAIMSANIDEIVTSWNPAAERMFGYLAEEIIGQSFSLLIPPENTRELADNQSNIRDGYTIEPYETLRIRKDGGSIPISLTISPIYDVSGVVIGASGIARDITQEKQMIRQLEEMNELRNEFVATVAHDLRAPMSSISGFAHLLVDKWNTTDDGKKIEYLQIISRNTDTLAQFVEDVLQVARIEAGEFTYDIASFDIRVLAQRALDEAIGPSTDRRLELITPDDLPLVLGDEERQWQVLTNLLSNALKFSPAQEPIVIELASIGDFVQVAVIDRGIGIAEDDLPKLFHKSGRLVKPENPITPGNGLGLYICKTLVEAQGGRIWCESAPGQGSTFFYTIPVAR